MMALSLILVYNTLNFMLPPTCTTITMSSQYTPIFYDPDAPPPALYLLTCQTDFSHFTQLNRARHPQSITHRRSASPQGSRAHTPPERSRTLDRAASAGPYVKRSGKPKITFASPLPDEDSQSESSDSSALTRLSEDSVSSSC